MSLQPLNLGCSLIAPLRVHWKPERSLTPLTVLPTEVDRWEGHLVPTDS